MIDFNNYSPSTVDPAFDLVPITPDDGIDLPDMARAIRCKPSSGTAGTLRITTRTGEVRNTEIGVGETMIVQVIRVHATGTTAAGLEALT
ncbi:MAG: hypothetical protein CML66_14710 [Rhodobacteraceae bacterium]|nr:hypothetical protein [Paracoccaceae bacterium]MAY47167.1 hypothetical protein [Paracoccaceae bacterium]|tara:strand:+ start:207 stop:476 length:270 start_codon:yes stop_codon:yes gene_type:complete